ncbi:hypothetical protein [Streptomyces chartreusis]|uniref:hypothetical protein n=1 Tax=Streptomyces chartreusis TaxID=1969 RepID=UPI0037DCB06E|nr:hypothetical protein OG938_48315 [Streptomyces chartreusis]
MNLGDIITRLEAADPQQVVPHGFHNPHSYRGDYYDLAFEPATNITVADMLEAARSAVGATYEGWKGGDFRMNEYDWCWLSEEGTASGETISPLLLEFMLTPPTDRASVLREAADHLAREGRVREDATWSEREAELARGWQDAAHELRRMAAETPKRASRWGVCDGCDAAAGPDCDCPTDTSDDHSCAESGCSGEPATAPAVVQADGEGAP